ncbi:hypothetical protein DXG01_001779 [Tephrocybe rancida]|nr:hypothetical protein DXG01_001779 [Tephrocybe rancida]
MHHLLLHWDVLIPMFIDRVLEHYNYQVAAGYYVASPNAQEQSQLFAQYMSDVLRTYFTFCYIDSGIVGFQIPVMTTDVITMVCDLLIKAVPLLDIKTEHVDPASLKSIKTHLYVDFDEEIGLPHNTETIMATII